MADPLPPAFAPGNVAVITGAASGIGLAAATRLAAAGMLILGFTYTGMTARGPKPDAAWTAGQVVEFMLAGIAANDFYLLCPDNAVDRATDAKRIRWGADDIVLNRPALSRWHPDYADAFAAYMAG